MRGLLLQESPGENSDTAGGEPLRQPVPTLARSILLSQHVIAPSGTLTMLLELQSRFRQSLPPALLDDFDNLLVVKEAGCSVPGRAGLSFEGMGLVSEFASSGQCDNALHIMPAPSGPLSTSTSSR